MHNFAFNSAKEIRYGQDPVLDALLLHFMTENSLEHSIDPENAAPEQIRFIVSLDEDSFYAPCGDWMLHFLLKARLDESLRNEYADQWNLLVRTVCAAVPKGPARRRILHLCRHKFRMTLKAPILIPSRLLKRMLTIFLALSGIPDPFQETKRAMYRRAQAFLESSFYNSLVNVCPDEKRECVRISRWLARNGPIDVCILGLGRNGHIAMNEPAATLLPHAHVARLAPSSLKHSMLKGLARKPRYGLTLGMGDILGSRKILLLVSGRAKRAMFRRLVRPQITSRLPASLLWLHPDVTVLADKDAAAGPNP